MCNMKKRFPEICNNWLYPGKTRDKYSWAASGAVSPLSNQASIAGNTGPVVSDILELK